MQKFLDFEKPIADLVEKIDELRQIPSDENLNIADEISKLQQKSDKLMRQIYTQLNPWDRVQIARHENRPRCKDYLSIFDDFVPLSGDRLFGEDKSIMAGLGRIADQSVMIIGQEKGHDTESRIKHSFGMPKPEGYRKAQRLIALANRFKLPIITIIDTPGASPGIDAEERGQAEAIAKSIDACLSSEVPIISVVIGEGSSGGAIAIATANYVMMLENSIYSVISPEGCASILWRSAEKAPEAAKAQKLTAKDLFDLGVIDEIIREPEGGAHRHSATMVESVKIQLSKALVQFRNMNAEEIKLQRRNKYLNMGSNKKTA